MIHLFFSKLHRRKPAQAMVEFALALPILLLVVYGLLETGRLIFIYASTVTAARQAVRYGSATGVNADGTPYFEDCDGIRAAVHNVGFINAFNDDDILISYDGGLESDGTVDPLGSPAPDCDNDISGYELENGNRINVQVSTEWEPIVPIVPYQAFTITARSSRTILVSVPIEVTAEADYGPGGGGGGGSGALSLSVTGSAGPYAAANTKAGQSVTFTYTVENTGTDDVLGPFTVTDTTANGTVDTSNCTTVGPATLSADDDFSCSGSYTVQQPDLDTGIVSNLVSVSGTGVTSPQKSTSVILTQTPSLHLEKSASKDAASLADPNITYYFTLTNNGNVTLRSPFIVDDTTLRMQITCSGESLTPGGSINCQTDYVLQRNDIDDSGLFINHATATAKFKGLTIPPSNEATFIIYTPPIYLRAEVVPTSVDYITTAGDASKPPVNFKYYLVNNTDYTLYAPFTVSASPVSVTCPQPASLAAGDSIECNGYLNVLSTHLDAGTPISNSATATADKNAAANKVTLVYSNQVASSATIVQKPSLTLDVTAPATATTLNVSYTYNYTIQNTGNVTLTPTLTDDKADAAPVCNTSGPLAGGATRLCTSQHKVTQADIDAGSIINTATVSATFVKYSGETANLNPSDSSPVLTYIGPRLTVSVAANPTTVPINTPTRLTFTLANTGSTTLSSFTLSAVVTNTTTSDVRTENADCITVTKTSLPKADSTTCFLDFVPTQAGSYSVDMNPTAVNSDDPPTAVVIVKGLPAAFTVP